jgi:SAM-dependent methyltransferase
MEKYYRVVSMPPRDLRDERVLIVGPRNIQELFIAWLYGFKWESITGIDLYSTNPKIRVMDMENMEYEDGSFDAVIMAHTLAYSKDVQKCITEVSRVLTEGGRFVFNATYFPDSDEYPANRVTGSQVRGYCSEAQLEPYYYECSEKINALGGKQASHLFGVRKSSSNEPFDPIGW